MRLITRIVAKRWIDTLRALESCHFVNLWSIIPDRAWRKGDPGDIILFIDESRSTHVLGFGLLHCRLPDLASRAWRRFGLRNGVESLHALRRLVKDYRPLSQREDPMLANLIVASPVFFPDGLPFEIKGREISSVIGRDAHPADIAAYVSALRLGASRAAALAEHLQTGIHAQAPATAFRPELMSVVEAQAWSAYGRRCALTGCRVGCALETVFIQPLEEGGVLDVSNVLLLREDLAAMQNEDLIAVLEDGKLVMSSLLASLDPNVYHQLSKMRLREALLPFQRPDPDGIRWRLARYHQKQVSPNWDDAD